MIELSFIAEGQFISTMAALISQVPEPQSFALSLLGRIGLGQYVKRQGFKVLSEKQEHRLTRPQRRLSNGGKPLAFRHPMSWTQASVLIAGSIELRRSQ